MILSLSLSLSLCDAAQEPLWVQYAEKAGPPFTKREHGSAVIVGSYLQAGGELAELGKECSAENHAELDCTGLDERQPILLLFVWHVKECAPCAFLSMKTLRGLGSS